MRRKSAAASGVEFGFKVLVFSMNGSWFDPVTAVIFWIEVLDAFSGWRIHHTTSSTGGLTSHPVGRST